VGPTKLFHIELLSPYSRWVMVTLLHANFQGSLLFKNRNLVPHSLENKNSQPIKIWFVFILFLVFLKSELKIFNF